MEHGDAWIRLSEVSSLYHCAQVLDCLACKCLEYMDKGFLINSHKSEANLEIKRPHL